jgi:hypothetical protein
VEQLLKSLPDENSDGIPDVLSRILHDGDFGLGNEKWKNRRKIIFWTAGSAWGACLVLVGIVAWKMLVAKEDIPPGITQMGTAFFYAMNAMAATLILGYCGISQADTNAYRKHSVDLAKAVPSAPQTNAYGYGYNNQQQQFGQGYGYDPTLPPPQVDMSAPPVPPTPIGPTERKNVIM